MSTTSTHQNQHVNPHLALALNLFAPASSYRPPHVQSVGKDCYNCGAENITAKNCPVCGTCVTCQI